MTGHVQNEEALSEVANLDLLHVLTWTVLGVWESEIRADPLGLVQRVIDVLRGSGTPGQSAGLALDTAGLICVNRGMAINDFVDLGDDA